MITSQRIIPTGSIDLVFHGEGGKSYGLTNLEPLKNTIVLVPRNLEEGKCIA
jgi:hypothetical protein